jgi:hypothetical protein
MPEVPPFPFPMQVASPSAAPLSLAEALGSQTPGHRTQLSLATSLSPGAPSVLEALAGPRPSLGTNCFTFTLRKADGADLGLNVSHYENDKALRVESVRAEGAVEAWNRQCQGGVSSEKAVQSGDRIVGVNSVTGDPVKMLEECRDKQLLKLTILRGTGMPATSPKSASAASKAATTLRADASVFVPKGPDREPPKSPEKDGDQEGAKRDGEAESTAASSIHATPESGKPEAVNERV